MSTSDDIEYDAAILKEMTTKELTYQLLCHVHLERPLRPSQVKAAAFQARVLEHCELAVAEFEKVGATPLAAQVQAMIDAYLHEEAVAARLL